MSEEKCVVIGLQSTGENGVEQELNRGEVITDFISAPAACLRRLLYKCFPLPKMPASQLKKRKLEKAMARKPALERKLRRMKRSSVLFADDTDSSGDLSSAELPDTKPAAAKRKSVLSDDSSVEFVGITRANKRSEGSIAFDLAYLFHSKDALDIVLCDDDSVVDESEDSDSSFVVSDESSGKDDKVDPSTMAEGDDADSVFGLDPSAGWDFSDHPDIGKGVRRFFGRDNETVIDGKVVGYLSAERNDGLALWHVVHSDGDVEGLNAEELREAKLSFDSNASAPTSPEPSLGPDGMAHAESSVSCVRRVIADDDEEEMVESVYKTAESKESFVQEDVQEMACSTGRPSVLKESSRRELLLSNRNWDFEGPEIGTRVRKHFAGFGDLEGSVLGYLNGRNNNGMSLWHVKYDDSDEEDLEQGDFERSREAYLSHHRPVMRLNGGGVIVIDSDDDGLMQVPAKANVRSPAPAQGSRSEEAIAYDAAVEMRKSILSEIENLNLPGNPLDILINELGGVKKVAELTGRKSRLIKSVAGTVRLAKRNENGVSMERQNLHEKELFMSGKKLVAIISEAASSGISLQADKRVPNQRQRVHITLELAWSADKAIQQLGRSHRSNQSSAPHYKLLISPIGGERRFASAVAKRLESLGALLQGDRRAAVGTNSMSMSNFNFDSKYGKSALNELIAKIFLTNRANTSALPELDASISAEVAEFVNSNESILNLVRRILRMDAECKLLATQVTFASACQIWLSLVGVDRDMNSPLHVAKFFNRLLGLESRAQRALFELYVEYHDTIIRDHKRRGTYDLGIMELGANGVCLHPPESIHVDEKTGDHAYHLEVTVDRSVKWSEAEAFVKQAQEECEIADAKILQDMQDRERRMKVPPLRPYKTPRRYIGFYATINQKVGGGYAVIGVSEKPSVFEGISSSNVICLRPLTGKNEISREYVREKYRSVDLVEAKVISLSPIPILC